MDEMLRAKRPFHKAGSRMFLNKIPAEEWVRFIRDKFAARRREVTEPAVQRILDLADLIPYDVQRIAHEVWDYPELGDKKKLDTDDVERVVNHVSDHLNPYFFRTPAG